MPDDELRFSLPGDRDHFAEIGTLAGGLVHELKNPLGVIMLNSELLLSQSHDIAPDPAMRERLEKRLKRIFDSSRNLQAIVDSFLGFARPSRPEPDAVDINQLLRELVEEQSELDEKAGVKVTLSLDENLPQVPADRQQLRSVFLNIIENARDALVDRAHERTTWIVTRAGKNEARIMIANNGPPIPERILSHIFDPFFSSKDGGTGLGLAIVRRLVEMHHGTVTVSSDPQQGVSFALEFPTSLGPTQHRSELPLPTAEGSVREDSSSSATESIRHAQSSDTRSSTSKRKSRPSSRSPRSRDQ
jgi:two-component system NtrC family sensor kinase